MKHEHPSLPPLSSADAVSSSEPAEGSFIVVKDHTGDAIYPAVASLYKTCQLYTVPYSRPDGANDSTLRPVAAALEHMTHGCSSPEEIYRSYVPEPPCETAPCQESLIVDGSMPADPETGDGFAGPAASADVDDEQSDLKE